MKKVLKISVPFTTRTDGCTLSNDNAYKLKNAKYLSLKAADVSCIRDKIPDFNYTEDCNQFLNNLLQNTFNKIMFCNGLMS